MPSDDDDDRSPPGGGPPGSPPGSGSSGGVPPVTRASIAARLARPEVMARLAKIVRRKTPEHRVTDAISALHVAILEAEEFPDEEAGIDPWMDRIASNRSVDEVRAGTRERSRDGGVEDLDELPTAAAAAEPVELIPWLKGRLRHGSTDAETVEILEDKARRKHTYAQCAEAHGMTEAALKKRVARLVAKHEDAWKRHKREEEERTALLWLVVKWAIVLLVAAAVGLLAWRLWPRLIPIGPDPVRSAVPVNSAGPPVKDEKDIANPPDPSPGPKPGDKAVP